MDISELEIEHEFKIEKDEKNIDIEHIIFKDGRKYKLQHPGFFELHDALSQDNAETALFKLGLSHLFPEAEKTPIINNEWLEKNKIEGLNLWSILLRGLLKQPPT